MKKEEQNIQSTLQSDKIDVEELLKDLRVQKKENFSTYLREVFRVPLNLLRISSIEATTA